MGPATPALAQHIDATSAAQIAWVTELGQCESNGTAIIKHLDVDGYFSYGLVQFHMGTFLNFASKYQMTVVKDDIYNPNIQIELARHMLDDGLQNQWYTCSKVVSKKLGEYPK